ncbi:hypothetical protein EP7_002725 [Isosphaeraceae bacterium EP7]
MSKRSGESESTFVVTVPKSQSADDPAEKLAKIGDLEPVAGHPGVYLLSVRSAKADHAGMLGQVRELLGDGADVQPVLRGEKGELQIPTGQVTVRFKSSPSDLELHKFAGPLGLDVERRNAYVPSQVSFRASKGAEGSVCDLVEKIRKSEDLVHSVWPETLSKYRRE